MQGGLDDMSIRDPFQDNDLPVSEAVERIIALHNEEPGEKGGYYVYHPFWPQKSARTTMNTAVRIGYVVIAKGHTLPWNDSIVRLITRKVETARKERETSTRTFPS